MLFEIDQKLDELVQFLCDFCVDSEIVEKDVYQVYIDECIEPEFDQRWVPALLNKSRDELPENEELRILFTNPAYDEPDVNIVDTFMNAVKNVLDQQKKRQNLEIFNQVFTEVNTLDPIFLLSI